MSLREDSCRNARRVSVALCHGIPLLDAQVVEDTDMDAGAVLTDMAIPLILRGDTTTDIELHGVMVMAMDMDMGMAMDIMGTHLSMRTDISMDIMEDTDISTCD